MKRLTIEATAPDTEETLEAISALGIEVEVSESEPPAEDASQTVFEFYGY